MLTKEWTGRLSAVGLAALAAFGCQDTTGSRLVPVQVSLARADIAASAALAPQDVTSGVVDPNNVATLTATLDSVQLQTSGSQGWQTVKPSNPPLSIDLLDLPGVSAALDLGTVLLETGACKARLFLTDPTISFISAVSVGQASFDAATEYDLTIPSGPQTGLKADGTCTVTSATSVTLAFDANATVGTIAVTGSASILLSPVIHIAQP